MPFKPGQSGNPSGRPRGRANKHNRDLKDMFFQTLHSLDEESMQNAGEPWLLKFARANPERFFEGLVKLLPRHVALESEQTLLHLTLEDIEMLRQRALATKEEMFIEVDPVTVKVLTNAGHLGSQKEQEGP